MKEIYEQVKVLNKQANFSKTAPLHIIRKKDGRTKNPITSAVTIGNTHAIYIENDKLVLEGFGKYRTKDEMDKAFNELKETKSIEVDGEILPLVWERNIRRCFAVYYQTSFEFDKFNKEVIADVFVKIVNMVNSVGKK